MRGGCCIFLLFSLSLSFFVFVFFTRVGSKYVKKLVIFVQSLNSALLLSVMIEVHLLFDIHYYHYTPIHYSLFTRFLWGSFCQHRYKTQTQHHPIMFTDSQVRNERFFIFIAIFILQYFQVYWIKFTFTSLKMNGNSHPWRISSSYIDYYRKTIWTTGTIKTLAYNEF